MRTARPLCLLAGLWLAAAGMPAAAVESVRAQALFAGKAVLSIDGRREVLRAGETSADGVTLVSADAGQAVIEVAGERRTLALDGRISGSFGAAPARAVVRLVPGRHGHYFVDGQINGNPVRFLVDTGASTVAISKDTARGLGIAYRVDGKRGTVQTAGGLAMAWSVTFDEVKVQALTLKRVRGIVIDGDAPSEALLGQSFLNRLDIHREGQVMELRAR